MLIRLTISIVITLSSVSCMHDKVIKKPVATTIELMSTCQTMCAGYVMSYSIHAGECKCNQRGN